MSKLYIIDANVIIYLVRNSKIRSLLKKYEIYMTETILNEIKFDMDPNTGIRKSINLNPYIKIGRIKILPSLDFKIINTLKAELNKPIPGIHEGELEAISYVKNNKNYIFCCGDGAAIIALGFLGISEQGVSLERLIGKIKNMEKHYTEKFFKEKIKKGKIYRVQHGLNLKKKSI